MVEKSGKLWVAIAGRQGVNRWSWGFLAVFRGAHHVNVDDKGRVAIPARFRERLATHCNGDLVVTIDTEERCLLIYPQPDWDDVQAKVEALPSFNVAARRVQRLLIGHATDMQMDSAGRILLTPPLRGYAQLEKKGMLVGQGRKLELWEDAAWQALQDSRPDDPSGQELPAELLALSL